MTTMTKVLAVLIVVLFMASSASAEMRPRQRRAAQKNPAAQKTPAQKTAVQKSGRRASRSCGLFSRRSRCR